MKTNYILAILIAGTSLQASAQRPQGPPPDPIAKALDKNDDQELSSSEIKGAIKSLLKLDKNKDENLSKEELRPKKPRGDRRRRRDRDDDENRPPRPPASTLMNALDLDSSGDLSKEELAASPESLLKLDQDSDKKLSSEEAGLDKPSRPRRGGGGRNGGGGENRPDGPPRRGPGRYSHQQLPPRWHMSEEDAHRHQ